MSLRIYANLYDYTTQQSMGINFPISEDQEQELMQSGHEIMVDWADCLPIDSELGLSIQRFNRLVKELDEAGYDKEKLNILSRTYLLSEIESCIHAGDDFIIVDVGEESKNWFSCSIHDDDDMGRLLYELGFIAFPAEVPEALVDYMDYAMLFRDEEINMGIRKVITDNGRYLVW